MRQGLYFVALFASKNNHISILQRGMWTEKSRLRKIADWDTGKRESTNKGHRSVGSTNMQWSIWIAPGARSCANGYDRAAEVLQ